MLNTKHYTTPLIPPENRPPLKEEVVPKPSLFRIFWLLSNLSGPLLMALRIRFNRQLTTRDLALVIRDRLERMGGVWIKAGQVLGMRTDLFPLEFCIVLSELQDRAFAVPPEQALPMIRAGLTQPIEEVFDEFDTRPVAAASLAQVYKARLRREGITVAVKLLRPYARQYFHYDFRWLRRYILLLKKLDVMSYMQWEEMIDEIYWMMEEELDFLSEGAATRRMRKQLRAHKVYVPKVFFDYSSDKMLVMEYLSGVFMSDYALVKNRNPEKLAAWEQENNIQPKKVARRLLRTLLRQAYEEHSFHGDLHPGNIVLLRNSGLALVDFGSTGTLDKQFAAQFDLYIRSQAEGNFSRAADILLIMSGKLPLIDTAAAKKDIVRALQAQANRSGTPGLSFHERSMTYGQAAINRVVGAHRLPVNWSLLKLGRTFGAADVNFGILNPEFNYVKETARYYEDAAMRRTINTLRQIPKAFEVVTEFIQFAIPPIMKKMYQFEGFATTGRKVATFLFRLLWVGACIPVLAVIYVFLYQHHRALVAQFHEKQILLTQLIESVPFVHQWVWYGLIIVLLYVLYRFAKFIIIQKRQGIYLTAIENLRD